MIYVVTGFGRCGSSLTMQMLQAGGFPVTGSFPAYEDHDAAWHVDEPDNFALACDGRAVKRLDPQRWPLPPGPRYKVIWLDRDPVEQAKSALKMIDAVYPGVAKDKRARRLMAKSYVRDRPLCLDLLEKVGADVMRLRFEDLVEDTAASAVRIAIHFGADLNIAAMFQAVRDRETGGKCLPYLLETRLLAGTAL